jgi:hypothetical protein
MAECMLNGCLLLAAGAGAGVGEICEMVVISTTTQAASHRGRLEGGWGFFLFKHTHIITGANIGVSIAPACACACGVSSYPMYVLVNKGVSLY